MGFYKDVDEGLVQSTMVLAVPRSVSSALAKALSTSPDFGLYIFQPFYLSKEPAEELDNYIRDAQADKGSTRDNPLKVLMKVMAESVSGQRFHHMMTHSDNICTLLRDPQSQALSAFRAYYEKQARKDTDEQELKTLKQVRSTRLLRNYIVTPWEHMEKHVRQLENHHAGGRQEQRWVVLDGDILRASPEPLLKRLCSRFGITYSPHMIEGWKEEEDKTVGIRGKYYSRNWLGRVQQSTGIKQPSSMTPRLEDFSKAVRAQIEQNLKTYVRLLAHEQTLAPSPDDMKTLMKDEGFHLKCPVSCYALVSVWPEDTAHTRDATLAKIRAEKPEYVSSFDIIDKTLGHGTPSEMMGRKNPTPTPHVSGHRH